MERNKRFAILFTALILVGCNRSPNVVFVNLDEVVAQQTVPTAKAISIPAPPAARPETIETIPGEKGITLADPANAPSQNVQEMFRSEQAKALAELKRRLRLFYQGEAQEFSLLETKSLATEEKGAYTEANLRIRTLFEAWAAERAPKFAQLAILEGFPLPPPDSKPPEKTPTPEQQRRIAEASKLRTDLQAIDAHFHTESETILASVHHSITVDQAALKLRIDQKARDLDKRAEEEANSQIRMAVSKLSFQLSSPAPIRFPPTNAHHLSIPAEKRLDPAPQVPSDGILERTADRKRLLEHELRIWLALNRYTLTEDRKGHRDATQEFQKWRQLHGAGL